MGLAATTLTRCRHSLGAQLVAGAWLSACARCPVRLRLPRLPLTCQHQVHKRHCSTAPTYRPGDRVEQGASAAEGAGRAAAQAAQGRPRRRSARLAVRTNFGLTRRPGEPAHLGPDPLVPPLDEIRIALITASACSTRPSDARDTPAGTARSRRAGSSRAATRRTRATALRLSTTWAARRHSDRRFSAQWTERWRRRRRTCARLLDRAAGSASSGRSRSALRGVSRRWTRADGPPAKRWTSDGSWSSRDNEGTLVAPLMCPPR